MQYTLKRSRHATPLLHNHLLFTSTYHKKIFTIEQQKTSDWSVCADAPYITTISGDG